VNVEPQHLLKIIGGVGAYGHGLHLQTADWLAETTAPLKSIFLNHVYRSSESVCGFIIMDVPTGDGSGKQTCGEIWPELWEYGI
jgi:hypothetical protein